MSPPPTTTITTDGHTVNINHIKYDSAILKHADKQMCQNLIKEELSKYMEDHTRHINEYTFIIVHFDIPSIHNWPDAPSEVAHLRIPHSHVFNFEVAISVTHDDRELEFELVKRKLAPKMTNAIEFTAPSKRSCELMAKQCCHLVEQLYGPRDVQCKVFEDHIDGASHCIIH